MNLSLIDLLAIISIILAMIPAGMMLINLALYRKPQKGKQPHPVSVLIPARNEAANIGEAIQSVLQNHGVELEVIVLDDHSTDGTADIVRNLAAQDQRVRLEHAPALPPGWCGKQHACQQLSQLARFDLLLFMDADVRLAADAVERMTGYLYASKASLISGLPGQITVTFSERLLIPLIHFILLGFLPVARMRRSCAPAYAAGCGQLFMARREAYFASGGHASIRDSLHDGIKLPRSFRMAGKHTDLFDATDVATCRMFTRNSAVWKGLGRNAREGLATPGRIVPFTLLLGGGQILPFLLFAVQPGALTGIAVLLAWLPRIVACLRFQQSWTGALLHPLGVAGLLAIQWAAFLRSKPAQWKGRSYTGVPSALSLFVILLLLAPLVSQASKIPPFSLEDQFGQKWSIEFPAADKQVVFVADRIGSRQIEDWIRPLYGEFDDGCIVIVGVADVSNVPAFFQNRVRNRFRNEMEYPVMLDWNGDISAAFNYKPAQTNVYILDRNGQVISHQSGEATKENLEILITRLRDINSTREPKAADNHTNYE